MHVPEKKPETAAVSGSDEEVNREKVNHTLAVSLCET
jgi:hypothetical protein